MAKETQEKMENQEEMEQQNQSEEQDDRQQNQINMAILGGVVGAGIGLLSSPETSKKVFGSLGQSEIVRSAGKELRRTAQEIIAEQAMAALRQTATGYLDKGNITSLLAPKKKRDKESNSEKDSSGENELNSSQYNELKEENKNMNDQLQRIEEMLNQLIEAKK